MKNIFILTILISGFANANQKFHLNITNGGAMPISPPIVYTSQETEPKARISGTPTTGFIKICQSGDATDRLAELKADKSVKSVVQIGGGPIFPGESRDLIVEVTGQDVQGIHVESMYGKTKDTCAVASFNRHQLYALTQKVVSETLVQDRVVVTGAFSDPTVDPEYLNENTCESAKNAVECLRELSMSVTSSKKIRYANGYLPSVLKFLEEKFGAADVQTLLIPAAGALRLSLQLPH